MKLTEEHVSYIIQLIDEWGFDDGVLTLPKILSRFKIKYGKAPTDRTIRNYPNITNRVKDRKLEISSGSPSKTKHLRKPSSLAKAVHIIDALEKRVEKLEKENLVLTHKFVVWQKNAIDNGMTEAQLNQPLLVSENTIASQDK